MVQAPGVDTVQRAGDGQCQLAGIYSFGPGGAADLGLEGAAHRLAHSGGVDAETSLRFCLDEHIPQVGRLLDIQGYSPIDPAVGQVIDLAAKRRDVQVFPAVAAHSHHVLLSQMQRLGQVYGKGGVAAAMVEQPPPVAEDGGVMATAPKVSSTVRPSHSLGAKNSRR